MDFGSWDQLRIVVPRDVCTSHCSYRSYVEAGSAYFIHHVDVTRIPSHVPQRWILGPTELLGLFVARRVGFIRMLSPKPTVEIWPELFHYVCGRVHADLQCQR